MTATTIPPALEHEPPAEVVRWAARAFGLEHLVVTASFEDAVLVHVAATAAPGIEIILLDTQYLFAETQWLVDQLTERLDITVRVVRPLPAVRPDNLWQTDVEACCAARKVEPLSRALAGKQAWITGVRRADGPTRADAPIAAYDTGRGLVKINPLATMERRRHGVVRAAARPATAHPLSRQGVRQHRLLAVHPAGGARRGQARRPLERQRQDRVRAARMTTELISAAHLDALTDEAITIIREVATECENPVLLFSGGKDSRPFCCIWRCWPSRPAPAAVPGHARRHRPQLPRGDRVPRCTLVRTTGTSASSSPACRRASTTAAWSKTPVRDPVATACSR